ncbi:MAG: hypothetical protein GY822_31020 [Deltaproteobacteria bacterium]|nr:hypothetical protein [Deltaproteobacteria bacterium]
MHYGEQVSGLREWRRQRHVAGDTEILWGAENNTDGDGSIHHVVQNHDCYFTDGFYSASSANNDSGRGMGILNWNAFGYSPICEVILDA